MKIRGWRLEYRALEYREPLDGPMLHIILIGIEIYAKVKVVSGHGGAIPRRPLQDVEPFENQDFEPTRRGEPWRKCSSQRLRCRPLQSRKDERHWPRFGYQGVDKEVQWPSIPPI